MSLKPNKKVAVRGQDAQLASSLHLIVAALVLTLGLGGCLASDSDSDPAPDNGDEPEPEEMFSIGGTAEGIGDEEVVLGLNEEETLPIDSDGDFEFETTLASGESYSVTTEFTPDNQNCSAQNSSGTIDEEDITDIFLECINTYEVSGDVSGLGSDDLELTLESGEIEDSLTIEDDGTFVFSERAEDGDSWSVFTTSQPDDRYCAISPGSGVVEGSNAEVDVTCEPAPKLTATSGIMKSHLEWTEHDQVNLKFSTDPECDWENYSQCDNSGMIADATGGSFTLKPMLEGTAANENYHVVAEFHHLQSDTATTLPSLPYWDTAPRVATSTDSHIYIGGSFDHVALDTGASALVTAEDAEITGGAARIEGVVYVATPDPDGGWFVGGDFERVDNAEVLNVVRLHEDGRLDENWQGGVDHTSGGVEGEVRSLLVDDGVIYVGGRFNIAEDGDTSTDRSNAAAFDAVTGEIDETWMPEPDGTVRAMADGDGKLFLAGLFSEVDETTREHLAAVNMDNGAVRSEWEAETDNSVYALARQGEHLYLAGIFSEVNGDERHRVAAVGTEDGETKDGWEDGYGQQALTIAVSDSRVFVGGFQGIRAYDPDDGEEISWGGVVSTPVNDLLVHNDTVYAAGGFDFAGGEEQELFAAFDLDSGDLLDWHIHALPSSLNDMAHAISVHDDSIFIGGELDAIGGEPIDKLAAMSKEDGTLADWSASLGDRNQDRPDALQIVGDQIYAGGSFQTAGGENQENLAVFDLEDGSLDSWAPEPSHGVNDIIEVDGTIFIGGSFEEFDGDEVDGRLVAVDADTREVLDWDAAVSMSSDDDWAVVESLDHANGMVYAGGDFEYANEVERDHLAAFDMNTGDLDMDFDARVDDDESFFNPVRGIKATESTLYATGDFDSVDGGQEQENLAAFDTSDGSPLTFPSAELNSASSVDLHENMLFPAGNFFRLDGESRRAFGAIDVTGPTVHEWHPEPDGQGFNAVVLNEHLLVLGNFDHISEKRRPMMMLYDLDTLEPVW